MCKENNQHTMFDFQHGILYCIVFLRLRKLFEHKCHDKCIVKTPVPRLGPFCWLPGYGRVPDARDYKACQSPHSEMVGRISLARDSNPGPFDPESAALTVRPLATLLLG